MGVDYTLAELRSGAKRLLVSLLQEIKALICKNLKLTAVIKYSLAHCICAPAGETAVLEY